MTTSKIGDYDFYILDTDEECPDDIDPFSYQFTYQVNDDNTTFYGMCNNISCQACSLQADCKDGERRSQALYNVVKDVNPELFI